ncbi:apolipoprotein D [Tetranychus urticae]|uniref:Lipocalin/cytosolic fatty-acid binding domain-containing protein n=1 Tax=Tetranychus urticae TaxID=32264 RepID=T1K6Y1_TETUR|nr:apolipoprotein D [Tetranychus urticae]
MKMIATLFVVFAFASAALGQCPVPPPVPAVDISKIAGLWYEIAGFSAIGFIDSYTCTTEEFTPREDGNLNITIRGNELNGSNVTDYGLVKRTDKQNLLDIYSLSPEHEENPYPIIFYVADTDYDNYLAASFCYYIPGLDTAKGGMILSRTNTMEADKYNKLVDMLVNKIKVPRDYILPTSQKDCKY